MLRRKPRLRLRSLQMQPQVSATGPHSLGEGIGSQVQIMIATSDMTRENAQPKDQENTPAASAWGFRPHVHPHPDHPEQEESDISPNILNELATRLAMWRQRECQTGWRVSVTTLDNAEGYVPQPVDTFTSERNYELVEHVPHSPIWRDFNTLPLEVAGAAKRVLLTLQDYTRRHGELRRARA